MYAYNERKSQYNLSRSNFQQVLDSYIRTMAGDFVLNIKWSILGILWFYMYYLHNNFIKKKPGWPNQYIGCNKNTGNGIFMFEAVISASIFKMELEFFVIFDPEYIFLDNRNNSLSGWPNRYFW